MHRVLPVFCPGLSCLCCIVLVVPVCAVISVIVVCVIIVIIVVVVISCEHFINSISDVINNILCIVYQPVAIVIVSIVGIGAFGGAVLVCCTSTPIVGRCIVSTRRQGE